MIDARGNSAAGVGAGMSEQDINAIISEAKEWVGKNYLSIEWFNSLFKAVDSNGDPILPNDGNTSNIDSIKAMFGFWTNQYISALGQGSGGGGGGGSLATLSDVALSSPQQGQVLQYDAVSTHWVNGIAIVVSAAQDGQVLTYNASTQQWVNGSAGVDMSTVWAALAESTNEQIAASHLSTALASYVTSTDLSTALASYVTSTDLSTTLADYVTSTSLSTTLADYVTSTSLSTTLADYVTSTSLTTTLASYASQQWVGQNYVSIAFFNRLFQAFAPLAQGETTATQVEPNDLTTTIDNIKAMFGLWTEEYLSALGLSSGGGVTLNEPLESINNASLGSPSTANVAIVWNGSAWVYGTTGSSYTLPTASASVLGGIKVGTTLAIDASGVLNQASGIATAGTYKSVTVDTYGRVTAGTNPTTLAGYGITDAASSSDLANYLPLAGGNMTGNIGYTGSQATRTMITFINNTSDTYGNGIAIGGGGLTIIGGGESASVIAAQHSSGGDEMMEIGCDNAVTVFSNLNNGWSSRKTFSFNTDGSFSIENGRLIANHNEENIITIKRTVAGAGAQIEYKGSNQDINVWRVGMNTDTGFAWYFRNSNISSSWSEMLKINDNCNIDAYGCINISRATYTDENIKIRLNSSSTNRTIDFLIGSGGYNMGIFNRNNGTWMIYADANNTTWVNGNCTGSAGSVAWANVSGHPTALSSFTNDSGYITSSGNCAGASKLLNNFSSRQASANLTYGDGTLRYFMATSSMTTGKPPMGDSSIIHCSWDNTGGYDKQLALGHLDHSHIQFRSQSGGTWSSWSTILDSDNYSTYALPLSGGTVNGHIVVNYSVANIITIKRTVAGAGAQIEYKGSNQDINVWRAGANAGLNFSWYYSSDSGSNWVEKVVIDSNANIIANGGVTALSDARHKHIIRDTQLSVEQIAQMPSVVYRWNDGREDDGLHVGSIAQNWQSVLPEVVLTANDDEHTLSMQYGVAACVSAIAIAKRVVNHEARIKELEKENADLKQAYSFIKNAYDLLKMDCEQLKLKIA